MLEIERLDAMLEDAELPFERDDRTMFCVQYDEIRRIKYPNCESVVFSVVQGRGTYGNEDNLLEVMDEKGEVQGWLTAEEVFERIKKHWSGQDEATV